MPEGASARRGLRKGPCRCRGAACRRAWAAWTAAARQQNGTGEPVAGSQQSQSAAATTAAAQASTCYSAACSGMAALQRAQTRLIYPKLRARAAICTVLRTTYIL